MTWFLEFRWIFCNGATRMKRKSSGHANNTISESHSHGKITQPLPVLFREESYTKGIFFEDPGIRIISWSAVMSSMEPWAGWGQGRSTPSGAKVGALKAWYARRVDKEVDIVQGTKPVASRKCLQSLARKSREAESTSGCSGGKRCYRNGRWCSSFGTIWKLLFDSLSQIMKIIKVVIRELQLALGGLRFRLRHVLCGTRKINAELQEDYQWATVVCWVKIAVYIQPHLSILFRISGERSTTICLGRPSLPDDPAASKSRSDFHLKSQNIVLRNYHTVLNNETVLFVLARAFATNSAGSPYRVLSVEST